MGLIKNIKTGLAKLLGKNPRQPQKVENVTGKEIHNIDEKMETKKANAEADAAMYKQKYEELKESIKEAKEKNIGKDLHKQREKLLNESLEGAISLKALFKKIREKDVKVASNDGGTHFGKWEDVWLLKNGQMAIVVKDENGEKNDVIRARDWPTMIRNYKNVAKTVAHEMVFVNLDDDGNHTPNIETQQVPDIVMDEKGNFVEVQAKTEEVQKLLAQKERMINQYRAKYKSSQEAWLREREEKRSLEDQVDLMQSRTDAIADKAKDELEQTKDIIANDRLKDRSQANLMNAMRMSKDLEQKLYTQREKLVNKVSEWFPETQQEEAEEKVQSMISWITNNVREEVTDVRNVEQEIKEQQGNSGNEGDENVF